MLNELENATNENELEIENELEVGSESLSGLDNENPGEKKPNKLGERFSKLTGDLKAKDAKIADLEKKDQARDQELAEARKRLEELNAPKAPDPDLEFLDPNKYDADKAAYDAYLKAKERKEIIEEAKQALKSESEQGQKSAKLEELHKKVVERVDSFLARGEAVGLSEEKLEKSAIKLNEAGISGEIQDFLLDDPDGAQLVDFLASSAVNLELMSKLSPLAQVQFIENTVRAQATLNKPTVSAAPSPLLNIKGGGAREQSEFDKLCPGAVFK